MKKPDWRKLRDGLGSAAAVPGLIEGLASPKKAVRARSYVELSEERLVHQGRASPAAAHAVPLLVESLRTPQHVGRAWVLRLLGAIAVGVPSAFVRSVDPRSVVADLMVAEGAAGDAYRAVHGARDDIARHLVDAAAEVRAAAVGPLVFVDPVGAGPLLVARLAVERDPSVAISLALGIGLAARCGAAIEVPVASRTAADHEKAARGVGRAIAGAKVDARFVVLALAPPLYEVETCFGRFGDLAIAAALTLGAEGPKVLSNALSTASEDRSATLVGAILRASFPAASAAAESAPLVSWTTLTPGQREALRLAATHATEDLWEPLAVLPSVGVVDWVPELRRYAGVDPRGPLERLVRWRGVDVEAVVVIDAWTGGACTEEEAREVLVAGLAPSERVDFALLVAGGPYGISRRPEWTAESAVAFASSLLDGTDIVKRLRECAQGAASELGYGVMVLLDALVRLAPDSGVDLAPALSFAAQLVRGPAFEEAYRRAFATLPARARDTLCAKLELPDRIDGDATIDGAAVGPAYRGWIVIDLAADRRAASRRAVSEVAAWTPLRRSDGEVRPLEAARRAIGALRPDSLAAIEKALPTATTYGRKILVDLRPN